MRPGQWPLDMTRSAGDAALRLAVAALTSLLEATRLGQGGG